jgi:hypothetical protein
VLDITEAYIFAFRILTNGLRLMLSELVVFKKEAAECTGHLQVERKEVGLSSKFFYVDCFGLNFELRSSDL